VIATRACNFPEISRNHAGWECDSDVDPLTNALKTALETHESERRERGQNGRRLVETSYAWPKISRELQQACDAYC
jgi:glycosyltransferase involved in cell wall biosynthesis